MNATTHHTLVTAALRSGQSVMTKSASASPEQADILSMGWPDKSEGLSKVATLSRVLASGLLVEEAEASLRAAGN